MQKPDPETPASLSKALADVRNALFVVADDANRLAFSKRTNDLASHLQTASYNLGEAERKLAAA
ncbi:MAG: hypothetical protein QOE65_2089 [Solirubrobacteraceae bacterium]|nr:hypothetical protein [Solirubrobacteraceae bacterium]